MASTSDCEGAVRGLGDKQDLSDVLTPGRLNETGRIYFALSIGPVSRGLAQVEATIWLADEAVPQDLAEDSALTTVKAVPCLSGRAFRNGACKTYS